MKKVLLGIFSLFLFVGIANAQKEDPGKALKKVRGLLASYNTNPEVNADKLDEAKDKIDYAMADATVGATFKALSAKGNVYNTLANRDVINHSQDNTYALKVPMAGVEAFTAYKMALEKAGKKYEKKEALQGLQATSNNIGNIGNILLGLKNYSTAYEVLVTRVEMQDILKNNGIDAEGLPFKNDAEFNDNAFVLGYCAMASQMNKEALTQFTRLIDAGYENAGIYAYTFNLMKEDDTEKALGILEKGRSMYPGDKEILFAEINYYIQTENYEVLKTKLEEAVAQSPDNPSVFSALGNVYMNLFQKEYAAGNMPLSKTYFNQSKDYYEKALALDPSLFEVQYSLGSLYYNKAVEITKLMNALPINEMKKYQSYDEQAKELFTQALPYFKKAESMNPNDMNTLIALKEIFARSNDFENSGEFKKRLEVIQSGGQNDTPFFKE